MGLNVLRYLLGDPVSVAWVSCQQLPVSDSDGSLDRRVPDRLEQLEPELGRVMSSGQQRPGLGRVLVFGKCLSGL